jgi:hypothetical protein
VYLAVYSGENMEWSSSATYQLINELEVRRCLWDQQDKEFKNKNARKESLHEIAEILETNMREVEKRIHNLKSQYNMEVSKVTKSKKSGAGYK